MNTGRNEADADCGLCDGLNASTPARVSPRSTACRVPGAILIDPEGKVRDVHVGYSPTLRAELTKAIEGLLPPK
jgi:hypothetical protein